MNTNRDCGCKGWNSCLICEKQYNLPPNLTKTKIEVGFIIFIISGTIEISI